MRDFEEAFHRYMEGNHPQLLAQIEEKKELGVRDGGEAQDGDPAVQAIGDVLGDRALEIRGRRLDHRVTSMSGLFGVRNSVIAPAAGHSWGDA